MARDSTMTRQRLLAAADALFYGEGIRPVGVDAVAREAGVTKRTLYYHFPSKDDLVAAYLDDRDLPTLSRYQGYATASDATADERIRGIFEQIARNAQKPGWRGCSFVRAACEFAGLPGHPARLAAARHKKRFEAWLEDVLAADGIADPAALARQIMILFDGAVTQILIHRDPSYAASAGAAAALLLSAASPRGQRTRSAATPGSSRPSSHSRKAPPAVET
jgi:AcrR family transcriptional regulator